MAARVLSALQELSGDWQQPKWIVRGKQYVVSRTTCSFGLDENMAVATDADEARGGQGEQDAAKDGAQYTEYDAELRVAPPEISEAARIVADAVREKRPWSKWNPTFALANKYLDGSETVGFHADHIMDLGPRPIIVGLTLGACRRFDLRGGEPLPSEAEPKTDRSDDEAEGAASGESNDQAKYVAIPLPHNSAVVMWNDAQENWQHAVPRCSNNTIERHPTCGLVRYSLTFRMKKHLPDLGLCNCGKKAGLKAKRGMYYLFCKPYGSDKTKQCRFWKRCQWAEEEAQRLKQLERRNEAEA